MIVNMLYNSLSPRFVRLKAAWTQLNRAASCLQNFHYWFIKTCLHHLYTSITFYSNITVHHNSGNFICKNLNLSWSDWQNGSSKWRRRGLALQDASYRCRSYRYFRRVRLQNISHQFINFFSTFLNLIFSPSIPSRRCVLLQLWELLWSIHHVRCVWRQTTPSTASIS